MSERSLRRAHARRAAASRRRAARVATTGAVSAGLLFAANASAASFVVDTVDDPGASDGECAVTCTLRDAVALANASDGDDAITFAAGLTGTIRLATTMSIDGAGLAITGPGAEKLAISGDNDSDGARDTSLLFVSAAEPLTLSGLTLTKGLGDSLGGALYVVGSAKRVDIHDAVLSDNRASGSGGAIFTESPLSLTDVTLSGNTAGDEGGAVSIGTNRASVLRSSADAGSDAAPFNGLTVDHVVATGNSARNDGGAIHTFAPVHVTSSQFTGNTSEFGSAGALSVEGTGTETTVSASSFTGNTAYGSGGAIAFGTRKYGLDFSASTEVDTTTISGNTAGYGGGVAVEAIFPGGELNIDRSTISGNHAVGVENSPPVLRRNAGRAAADRPGVGGGIVFSPYLLGTGDITNTTISGNTADVGGGVSFGYQDYGPPFESSPIGFDNSTIAGNVATTGGGINLGTFTDRSGEEPVQRATTVPLTSTIVADNTGGDLGRAADAVDGGFSLSFSLVEDPAGVPVSDVPDGSSKVGVDPQLGALADNGGPTLTHKPSSTSPVIDAGRGQARMPTDQRGQTRLVDTRVPNTPGGDGADIGAVELPVADVSEPPLPPAQSAASGQGTTVVNAPFRFAATVKGVHVSALDTDGQVPLIVANSTPVFCASGVTAITRCTVELRALNGGTVLASGMTDPAPASQSVKVIVKLTDAGIKALKGNELGLRVNTVVTAASAIGTLTETGQTRLLARRSITIPVGGRSTTLSARAKQLIDGAATVIKRAKAIKCVAYTSRGVNDLKLTRAQAKAACDRLKAAGVVEPVSSSGRGHASPIRSNKTVAGRVANRRIVIRFEI